MGFLFLIMLYNPWGVGAFLYLLLGLFCLALLFFTVQFSRRFIKNYRAPRLTVPAQVIRKWTREYDYDIATRRPSGLGSVLNLFFSPTITVYEQWVFWVSFLVRGQELEFGLPEKAYISLSEGEAGLLTYKGDKFLDFLPRPAGSILNDTLSNPESIR
jgi:hypothetical protein